MRSAYRVLALLVALGVFIQAGAIAYGWFQVINDVDNGGTLTSDSELNAGHALHGMNGMIIMPAVALILLLVSFFAKLPGGVKWAAIVFGLVVLQVVLAFVSFGDPRAIVDRLLEQAGAASAEAPAEVVLAAAQELHDEHDLPRQWIARSKEAIRTLGPMFSSQRMVIDYIAELYTPACEGGLRWTEPALRAAKR